MAKANFSVKIEDDGKVSVNTGDMSGEHHMSCDQFMKMLAELMGGPVEVKSTKGSHQHHHHEKCDQHVHH